MKLHQISSDIHELLNSHDIETIKDNLDSMELAFNDKAESIVKYTQNIEADINQVDDMIKQLQARKKVLSNKVESFREYVRYNMELNGFSKIECPLFTLTLKQPSKIVEIEDQELIPDEFVSVDVVLNVDKTKLKNALKSGDIPGAKLIDAKRPLQIKI
tara:strand:+ start:67 stop:543 length:477 start_codon:yes stop_codon:yes gene_type:complete